MSTLVLPVPQSGPADVYGAALGTARFALAPAVHDLHCTGVHTDAAGPFTVRRGRGPVVWLLATGLGLPASAQDVRLHLHIERSDDAETWQRRFGTHAGLRTTQRLVSGGRIEESVGRVRLLLDVDVRDGTLHIRQAGTAVRLRRWHLTLPQRWCPRTTASAAPAPDGRVAVTVRVTLPGGGLLVTYSGTVGLVGR